MKRIAIIVAVLIVVPLTALGVTATIHSALKPNIDADMRARITAEGRANFVQLPDGVIAYGLRGPADGPVLVLVHGFSVPRFVFDKNAEAFANAGYRVLTYDHYGRGYSDRPDLTYNADLYERELLQLLDALEITEPVHLLGYSMGGGIGTVFAARNPGRVRKLILIAPSGFMPPAAGTQAIAEVPVLGDWLFALLHEGTLASAFQKQVDAGIAPEYFATLYREQMQYHGYGRALLSSMRHFIRVNLQNEYELLHKHDTPTLLLWGTEDKIVPYAGHESVLAAAPHIRLESFANTSHAIAYEKPDEVNRLVIDFLKE